MWFNFVQAFWDSWLPTWFRSEFPKYLYRALPGDSTLRAAIRA